MLPGVLPGKNTPIVTNFLDDLSKLEKYDILNTLTKDVSMYYMCGLFYFSQNLFRILKLNLRQLWRKKCWV
jgi:hypothetical protein